MYIDSYSLDKNIFKNIDALDNEHFVGEIVKRYAKYGFIYFANTHKYINVMNNDIHIFGDWCSFISANQSDHRYYFFQTEIDLVMFKMVYF